MGRSRRLRRLRSRSALRRGILLAATAAALAVAVLFIWKPTRRVRLVPPSVPPAGSIAIVPFSVSKEDAPRFKYLSEGVADLLARDLEGGPMRMVDSTSVIRALGGDPSSKDLDKYRSVSAQMGAKYFVLGRVEDRGGDLVLEAVLHSTRDGQPLIQAVVAGKPAELLRLLRKLSDQLQLRPLPAAEFEARLARLTKQTSRSLAALQAWLEGEQLLRGGHWDEVIGAFQRAVAADPEFALAHYRLGVVADTEPGLAEDSLQRALRFSDRLQPSERLLVRGHLAIHHGEWREAERLLIEATQKYPENTEAWLQRGELYFHQNPLRARSPQEAADAFQHVLVIDPLNLEAMRHLADLAQMRGERDVVSRLSDLVLAHSDDPTTVAIYRIALAWARGDRQEEEKLIANLHGPLTTKALLKAAFVRAEWQMDGFADAEAIASAFAGRGTVADRAYAHQMRAIVQLLRGRPEAAKEELERAAEIDPAGDAAYLRCWIDTLEFVPVSPDELRASRQAAQRLDPSRLPQLGPAREYLLGALALRAGDSTAAEHAIRALERMPPFEMSSITTDLALALRARRLAAKGENAAALATLEQQQLRIPARYAVFFARLSEIAAARHAPGSAGAGPRGALRRRRSRLLQHAGPDLRPCRPPAQGEDRCLGRRSRRRHRSLLAIRGPLEQLRARAAARSEASARRAPRRASRARIATARGRQVAGPRLASNLQHHVGEGGEPTMAKTRKPARRRRSARKTAPRVPLAAFFRRLWSKPELLERFSSGAEGRAEVLGKFNLHPDHTRILEAGCVRDVIRELAGVKPTRSRMAFANSTVINATDDVDCGHEECRAFSTAVRNAR